MSVKTLLLIVLDAAMEAAPGPLLRTSIGVVRWAVEKFMPDDLVAAPRPVFDGGLAAAPDAVKAWIASLFEVARPYIKGIFILRIYDGIVTVFEGSILDRVWDAVVGIETAPPRMAVNEVTFCAAAAELDSALMALAK